MNKIQGVAVVEVICTNDRSLSRGTRLSENADVVSAVVSVSAGTGQTSSTWVEAGIMRGGVDQVFKVCRFLSGYISNGSIGAFFGRITLSPGDMLYLDARSADSVTVRLNVNVEREVE